MSPGSPAQNPHSSSASEEAEAVSNVTARAYENLAKEERELLEGRLKARTEERKTEILNEGREARKRLVSENPDNPAAEEATDSTESDEKSEKPEAKPAAKEEEKREAEGKADPAKTETPSTPIKKKVAERAVKAVEEVTEAAKSGSLDKVKDSFKKIFDDIKLFIGSLLGGKIADFIGKIFNRFKSKSDKDQTDSREPDSADTAETNDTGRDTEKVNEESKDRESLINGPDTTKGLKGAALFANPQFRAKTEQIAAKIGGGVTADDMYSIFTIESGGNPEIVNKIGATGLIQWMRITLDCPLYKNSYPGMTTQDIQKMSGLEQLALVEKHFSPHFGKLKKFSDIYRLVIYPKSKGKGPDYVFGQGNTKNPNWKVKVAEQNWGIALFCHKYPAMRNGKQVIITDKRTGKTHPLFLIDNEGFDRFCASRRGKFPGAPYRDRSQNA